MKRLLLIVSLMIGFVISGIPVYAEDSAKSAISATTCPDCSGPVVSNVEFTSGMVCECVNQDHLEIGPNVTVRSGATVIFKAPQITVKSGSIFERGANVQFIKLGVASITVTADPESIAPNTGAFSTITATLKDFTDGPVPKGTQMVFTTNLGYFPNSQQTWTDCTYDDTGVVVVYLYAGTTAGTATVTATSQSVSDQTEVVIGVLEVTLTATPDSIKADGLTSSILTATAKQNGVPVSAGTDMTFKTTLGQFDNQETTKTVKTDNNGAATATLYSSTTVGTATVTAECIGATAHTDISFTDPTPKGTIVLTALPSSISADGGSTSTIKAIVKSPENQAIQGAEVVFSTSLGTITSPHTTDETGQATAILRSARQNSDSVIVKATYNGIESTVTVAFTGITIVPKAAATSLLTKTQTTISATLTDAAGNPIPDAAVSLSATDPGKVNPASDVTDALGYVETTLTADTAGETTVTVSGAGATGAVKVTFTRYQFTLARSSGSIRVGGAETSTITAELKDWNTDPPVPVKNAQVNFGATLGTLAPYTQLTDENGQASSTFSSATKAGNVVIDANVSVGGIDLSASTEVVVLAGDAAKIVLTASPSVISLNKSATITATVYDSSDQPSPNQYIYFRILKGPSANETLSASVAKTNEYGVAEVIFTAGSLPSIKNGVEIEANTKADFSGSKGTDYLTIVGPPVYMGISMNLDSLKEVDVDSGSLQVGVTAVATDVHGNPVADGTKVYLGVESLKFDEDRAYDRKIDCWDQLGNTLDPCPPAGTPGFGFSWFSDDVNQDGTMYSIGGPMCTTEDKNGNGILDDGEDKNDNGVIDPIQGCVIEQVRETENGLCKATLTYPMSFANNITVKLIATAGNAYGYYDALLLCTSKMVDQGTCGIGY